MSLTFRADDCNELQSMENWLNAGTSWSEHHGIVDVEATASAPLFNHIAEASSTNGSPESLFDALRKGKEGIPTHTAFLKLDTVELCKDNPDAVFMRARSSSMVGSSSNKEEVSVHTNMLPSSGMSVSTLADRTASLDEPVLCMDADSPRGPLSPGALQLGKSPRRASAKRSFVDASEASWMPIADAPQTRTQHPAKLKQPKNGVLSQEEIQAPAAAIAYGPPFVGMATSGEMATLATPNPTAFLPGGAANVAPLLFPTPLTLPNVPSMEEIVQLRPKRRNVRISTDPQSVAARHRRERISDRVRVLQHFVPGGTKMDTASMLDEAIHYVKFLQQQLQTLERIGNMSDPRFMTQPGGPMILPQVGASTSMRPFDLNCAVYQANPATTMTQPPSQQQPLPWSITRVSNSFCSSFSDSAQEQFCH